MVLGAIRPIVGEIRGQKVGFLKKYKLSTGGTEKFGPPPVPEEKKIRLGSVLGIRTANMVPTDVPGPLRRLPPPKSPGKWPNM